MPGLILAIRKVVRLKVAFNAFQKQSAVDNLTLMIFFAESDLRLGEVLVECTSLSLSLYHFVFQSSSDFGEINYQSEV